MKHAISTLRCGVLLSLLTLPTHTYAAESISNQLDTILNVPALRGAISGVMVERLSDHQIIYSQNPDTRLMPASNRKLFTSALALESLGGDRTFTTDVVTTGNMDSNGTLHSAVYIRGGGDSMLTADDLAQLAEQVAKRGIKKITGPIVGDGTLFSDGPYPIGWAWDYLSDDYAPQISGLEVNRGTVTVHVKAGQSPAFPVQVTLDPPAPFVTVINHAITVAVGPKGSEPPTCLVQRVWDRNTITIDGSVPVGGVVDTTVTIADPARYAATVFAAALKKNGVIFAGPVISGGSPKAAKVLLASHTSPTVAETIVAMNKPSDNLLAESLMREVGVVQKQTGTFDAGNLVEIDFLKTLGIDPNTLSLADACGVSRRDYVTARSVTQLLVAMHDKPDWKVWYDSLPIAGVDGTLKKRMIGTTAQGNAHAKTGTMFVVCCLSGYVTAKNGDLYVFSLLMNNFPGEVRDVRTVQDRFVVTLADSL